MLLFQGTWVELALLCGPVRIQYCTETHLVQMTGRQQEGLMGEGLSRRQMVTNVGLTGGTDLKFLLFEYLHKGSNNIYHFGVLDNDGLNGTGFCRV